MKWIKTEDLSVSCLKTPLNVQSVFGSEPVALVSGRDIAAAARSVGSIYWHRTFGTR